jgi:hypothetical protein
MDRKYVAAVCVMAIVLAICSSVQVFAGGPVCRTPACGPQPVSWAAPCGPPVCGAPACPPPMCMPAGCPPPACGPRPMCENPVSKCLRGAANLLAGAVALPFAAVDCLIEGLSSAARGCRKPPCVPAAAPCMPCGPAMVGGPMPLAGPMPMMAPGMPPMGMGRPVPSKKMVPFGMTKENKDRDSANLFAGPRDGVFGNYW